MKIERTELLRYLGWRGQETDEALLARLDGAARRCLQIAEPRSVSMRFSLGEGLLLRGTGFSLQGKDIARRLAGCKEIYLLAATAGIAVERETIRLSARSAGEALLFDTAATCAVESYADDVCRGLAAACGRKLTPRFSCGYGDFPLEAQREICRILKTDTRIGVCCDEAFLLTPRKSITAVVGITEEEACPAADGVTACADCGDANCAFRREEP